MRQTTVFVVDDEEQICTLLTRILAREGLRAVAFASPGVALAAIEAERPDLLLTDLTMPGMTGLELAAQAKALRPSLSVVVMTGYASLENVVEALRSGIDDFVTKPFGVAEIREVVQRVLARRSAAAAGAPAETPAVVASADDAATFVGALADAAVRPPSDLAAIEAMHHLLGGEIEVSDLADRVTRALATTLGFDQALLFLEAPTDRLRVVSASRGIKDVRRGAEVVSSALAAAARSGRTAAVDPIDWAEVASPLGLAGEAFLATAAPLRVHGDAAHGSGVLVVLRASGADPFAAADLRVLGVAAAALGHVVAGACATEAAATEYHVSLLAIVAATERRSPWFRTHGARVRELSVRLGERLGLTASDLEVLDAAAPLLDLGRVELGDDVLAKQGRLSPDEWRALRSHPEAADEIVRPVGVLRRAKPVIRHHHENWDGTGYPDGLRGDDIPHLAAVVRIADSYAALTSPRPWRDALTPGDALRRMVEGSGTHYHPQFVAAFAEMQLATEDGA